MSAILNLTQGLEKPNCAATFISQHAMEQMEKRGIPTLLAIEAFERGRVFRSYSNHRIAVWKDIEVVADMNGNIVTAYRRRKKSWSRRSKRRFGASSSTSSAERA